MLGPEEGTKTTVDWSIVKALFMMLRQLLVWALLIPFLLLKSNRNKQAWAVLIPVVAVHVILAVLMQLQVLPILSELVVFSQVISVLTIGMGVLWLLFHKTAGRKRTVSFFISLGVMAAVGTIAVLCYTMGDFSGDGMAIPIMSGIGTITIAIGLSVTAYVLRAGFTPFRIILWLLVIIIVLSVVCTFVFFSINALIDDSLEFQKNIPGVLMMGSAIGLVIYVVLLPFVILTFKNSLYRSRFESFYRIGE